MNKTTKTAGKTITRADLAKALETDLFSAKDSYQFVAEFFASLRDAISTNDTVKIQGFGVFKCIKKAPRIGRNPKTKKATLITARRVVSFSAGRKLKKDVNQ